MPAARDRTGMVVNEGTELPRMRPRRTRKATDRHMVELLDNAIENLAGTACSFWACEGPNKARHMRTCSKCWVLRTIATVRATLAAREENGCES